jgi:hypothetical protein
MSFASQTGGAKAPIPHFTRKFNHPKYQMSLKD